MLSRFNKCMKNHTVGERDTKNINPVVFVPYYVKKSLEVQGKDLSILAKREYPNYMVESGKHTYKSTPISGNDGIGNYISKENLLEFFVLNIYLSKYFGTKLPMDEISGYYYNGKIQVDGKRVNVNNTTYNQEKVDALILDNAIKDLSLHSRHSPFDIEVDDNYIYIIMSVNFFEHFNGETEKRVVKEIVELMFEHLDERIVTGSSYFSLI